MTMHDVVWVRIRAAMLRLVALGTLLLPIVLAACGEGDGSGGGGGPGY